MIELRNRHRATRLLLLFLEPLYRLGENAITVRYFSFALGQYKSGYRINRGPWQHYHSEAHSIAVKLFARPR